MSNTVHSDFINFVSRFQLIEGTNQNETKSIAEIMNMPGERVPQETADAIQQAIGNGWIYDRDGDPITSMDALKQYLKPARDEYDGNVYHQLYLRDRNAKREPDKEETVYATRPDGHVNAHMYNKNEVLDVKTAGSRKTAHIGEQRPAIPKMNILQKVFSALTFGLWKPTKVRRAERGIAAYDAARMNAAKKLGFTMTPEETAKIDELGYMTRQQRRDYAYSRVLPPKPAGLVINRPQPPVRQSVQPQKVPAPASKKPQEMTPAELEVAIQKTTGQIVNKLRSFDSQKLQNDVMTQKANPSEAMEKIANTMLAIAGVQHLLSPEGKPSGPMPQDGRVNYLKNLQDMSKMSLDELCEFGNYMVKRGLSSALPDNNAIAEQIAHVKSMQIKPELPVAPMEIVDNKVTYRYTPAYVPPSGERTQELGSGFLDHP